TRVDQIAGQLELTKGKRGRERVYYPPRERRDGVNVSAQVVVLDYVTQHPGCASADVAAWLGSTPEWARQAMRAAGCVVERRGTDSRWYPPGYVAEPPPTPAEGTYGE